MKRATTLSDLRRAQPRGLDQGGAPARARSELVDAGLAELAGEILGPGTDVAVVAVGGYGRGELWPHSDIDLLFVSARRGISAATLRGVLYPLWDAGHQVGHALRTPKEAVDQAEADLDAATALLHARFIAGDPGTFEDLLGRRSLWLRKARKSLVKRIIQATEERHSRRDRAGWSLAPDLKDDVGGLRDVHTLEWLEQIAGLSRRSPRIEGAAAVLGAVREALHGHSRRKNDRLHIDLQPAVAETLELSLDDLMTKVHSAGRDIEHHGMEARLQIAADVLGGPRRSGATTRVRDSVAVEDGYLTAAPDTPPLEVLAAHAATGKRPAPGLLEVLERQFGGASPNRWDPETTRAFLDLLRGPHAPAALELLDHSRGFSWLLPEWEAVRGRAQHDPYHRYTVDGHTFVAVGEIGRVLESDHLAAAGRAEVEDLDALYLATLLHDIGKGSGQDHSIAGERMARRVCQRMDVSPATAEDVCALVRHHLLLSDTATRRDIEDGTVIASVARSVAGTARLWMLYVLTVADGLATGPRAWNDWKAALVRDLYLKVRRALETGELPTRRDVAATAAAVEALEPRLIGRAVDLLASMPPSYLDSVPVADLAAELQMLDSPPVAGDVRHRIEETDDRALVTVCVADRPGALARTAGVLSLGRISVLSAQAYSSNRGAALQRFMVRLPEDPDWHRLGENLRAAYSGRLALENQVERKVADYRLSEPIRPDVRILGDESEHSTVVEVRARDALGLLYATAAAIGDLGLDIRVAKIDTLGERVVDVFYVRNPLGEKLDEAQERAVEQAVTHRITRLLGRD